MATFFGSEALVEYTGFFTAVNSTQTIYTVPSGYYAEILIQKVSLFSGTGGINGSFKLGPYDSIPFAPPFPDQFNLAYELFEGQTFAITVTGVTGTANMQFTWRLKLFAAP